MEPNEMTAKKAQAPANLFSTVKTVLTFVTNRKSNTVFWGKASANRDLWIRQKVR
jgi:hypothetical protein